MTLPSVVWADRITAIRRVNVSLWSRGMGGSGNRWSKIVRIVRALACSLGLGAGAAASCCCCCAGVLVFFGGICWMCICMCKGSWAPPIKI